MMTVEKILGDALDYGIYLYLEDGELKYRSKKGGFPDQLKADLKKNRDAVIRYLKTVESQRDQQVPRFSALEKVDRDLTLPLSFSQQRLWLLDQIAGGSAHYNIPCSLKLIGKLNIQAFS